MRRRARGWVGLPDNSDREARLYHLVRGRRLPRPWTDAEFAAERLKWELLMRRDGFPEDVIQADLNEWEARQRGRLPFGKG